MTLFQELINHLLVASVVFSFVLAFRLRPTSFLSFPPKPRLQRVRVRCNYKAKVRRSAIL